MPSEVSPLPGACLRTRGNGENMRQDRIDPEAVLLGGPAGLFLEENFVRWYIEKHPKAGPSEIGFINSIPIETCPHCGCPRIKRDGKRKDGIQTYECLSPGCGKGFNPLTNTIFDSRKIPLSEWGEYLIHLFEYHSAATAATDNRNAESTGLYWLEKVFIVLREYQGPIVLGDLVWIDETYVSERRSRLALTEDGKRLRGLSRNQRCVYCATDGDVAVLIVGGVGKPSRKGAAEAYLPHIQCFSHVVHDGEKAHEAVISSTGSTETVIPTRMTKGVEDEDNPMDEINRVHRFFKRFLSRHVGYDRSRLQDWANLFAFIWNGPKDPKIKAMIFVSLAVSTPGLLRYREWKSGRKAEKIR